MALKKEQLKQQMGKSGGEAVVKDNRWMLSSYNPSMIIGGGEVEKKDEGMDKKFAKEKNIMETIECIFCNNSKSTIVIEENGFQGRQCDNCGLIYISPRPSLHDIIDLYGHDNADISAQSHISGSFVKRLYAKHSLKLIKKNIRSGLILEIGAGAGFFLDEARKQSFEVYGLEPNPIQANFIRNTLKIPCEGKPLDSSTFGGKKYDIIYHCDVISHFFDPISEFSKINERLNPNGYVVFETGNLGDVDKKYFKVFTKFQYPDHLFFFSENNLVTLLKKTGFEVVSLHRYSILPQLKLIKLLKNFFRHIKGNQNEKTNSQTKVKSTIDAYSLNFSFTKILLRGIYNYFFYLIRYKLGYLFPKKGRPQTIIVIAKKI